MAHLVLGLLGGFLLGGLFLLGWMLRDPRGQDEGARGPSSLALLRAARCRARRNLLGRRPKAR
jgi:hypothetical protein